MLPFGNGGECIVQQSLTPPQPSHLHSGFVLRRSLTAQKRHREPMGAPETGADVLRDKSRYLRKSRLLSSLRDEYQESAQAPNTFPLQGQQSIWSEKGRYQTAALGAPETWSSSHSLPVNPKFSV